MHQHSIARETAHSMKAPLSASEVEQAAQRVAVALDLLTLDAPLCSLADDQARTLRFLVRMALSDRTWNDAVLWCREYHAQQHYGKSFDHLTADQQNHAAQVVHRITSGAELYLEGFTEPLNGWTRRQAQLGAQRSDWLRGLPGGKAGA